MEYRQGKLGRVFVAKLSDGESIYDAVEQIAEKEGVSAAAVMAVGGIRSGKVVTGPEDPNGKVVPHYEEFNDARELVGFGTVFPLDGKPVLHFHAGMGREQGALVGCPRAGMTVYLTLEVVIVEIDGVQGERAFDPEWGVHLLRLLGG